MRKIFLLAQFLVLSLLLSSCSTLLFWQRPQYIKANGTQLEYKGRPYYFTGTNLWYGCYLGSKGPGGDRARLRKELDRLKSMGVTNLRILGGSNLSYLTNSLKPAIQTKPGVFNEQLLDGLDYLLSEMHKRGMHAVIFLTNYWQWSGGMAQYNDWANGGGGVRPSVSGYPAFMNYAASFYGNKKAETLFYNYVYDLLNRKNKYDGFYYRDDPTIMAWELANEPRPGINADHIDRWYHWIDSTAHYIHILDPNHLVTTGSEGTIGTLQDSTYFLKGFRTKYINYLTFHLWPKNWGWFNAKDISGTYDSTVYKALNYIGLQIHLSRELNKPIVMEEFGLPRDNEAYDPGTPTTARDRYFKTILGAVYDSAAAGAPIVGSNFWAWGGEGRPQHADHVWRPGDPYMGDPPQEPQGLNSVYNTDTSTIAVLKQSAAEMTGLDKSEKLVKREAIAESSRQGS